MGLWGPDPGPAPQKPTRNDPPSFLGPGPGWSPWGHGPGPTLILWANIFGCVCLPMVICLFFCVWQCMFLHSESPIGKCFCFWGGAATGMVHGIGGRVGPPRGPLGGGGGGAAAAMAPQGLGEWSPSQLPKMSKKHVLRISPEISPQQN
jgi:hypothetical protein